MKMKMNDLVGLWCIVVIIRYGQDSKMVLPVPSSDREFQLWHVPTHHIHLHHNPARLPPSWTLSAALSKFTLRNMHLFFYSYNITGELALLFFPGRLLIVLNADCEISGWGWGNGLFLGVPSTGAGFCLFMKDGPPEFSHVSSQWALAKKDTFLSQFLFLFSVEHLLHTYCVNVLPTKNEEKKI